MFQRFDRVAATKQSMEFSDLIGSICYQFGGKIPARSCFENVTLRRDSSAQSSGMMVSYLVEDLAYGLRQQTDESMRRGFFAGRPWISPILLCNMSRTHELFARHLNVGFHRS